MLYCIGGETACVLSRKHQVKPISRKNRMFGGLGEAA
jgi:hypothetical protein